MAERMTKVVIASGLQLPPKWLAWGIDTDAQPDRRTAVTAGTAGNGYRIRIRLRFGSRWGAVKNLRRNWTRAAGKPDPLKGT